MICPGFTAHGCLFPRPMVYHIHKRDDFVDAEATGQLSAAPQKALDGHIEGTAIREP